ncbi:MAG: CPBP family intramembrane metalloprotease [Tannerellaceae bacterium]|jgi:membrane protease YdiL (CAAX protease family)|nr:CPBP family intramembrane metalloprotease [Tannerellaceae bacterium]
MKFLERAFDQQNQAWKYLLVCVGALFVWMAIGSIPLMLVLFVKAVPIEALSKNLSFALLLLPSVVSLFLTVWLVKAWHRRSFAEVVNGTKRVRLDRCLVGVGVWFVLMTLAYGVDYVVNTEDYVLQFDLPRFIPLLLITFLLIPFQAMYEEFLFRGYLTQGLGACMRSRWMALLLPSLVFGLMHASNPEVKEFGFWLTMPQYIYFGLFFGLVAILDDGIELSIGLHAANNIFLSLFATHQSSALQTDAVFEVVRIDPVKDTCVQVVLSLVALLYFARKYKWNFRLLNGPIAP